MAIESMYEKYNNYVGTIVKRGSLDDFKANPDYTSILEHVSYEYGHEYLFHLRKIPHMTEEVIRKYCQLNDRVGGGIKYSYDFVHTSPSNFRYLLHAHLILTHWKTIETPPTTFVELGCGYGGLALAISFLCKLYDIRIEKYCMIDLPIISELQKLYLGQHQLAFPVEFYSAFHFGSDILHTNMFLISSYCFSEISKDYQKNYIEQLFPRVIHGFIVWNHIPLYHFGFSYKDAEEYPLTGPGNRYVLF